MLESEDESEGREDIVSNADLSLVNVDRWTRFPGARSEVVASGWVVVVGRYRGRTLNRMFSTNRTVLPSEM